MESYRVTTHCPLCSLLILNVKSTQEIMLRKWHEDCGGLAERFGQWEGKGNQFWPRMEQGQESKPRIRISSDSGHGLKRQDDTNLEQTTVNLTLTLDTFPIFILLYCPLRSYSPPASIIDWLTAFLLVQQLYSARNKYQTRQNMSSSSSSCRSLLPMDMILLFSSFLSPTGIS